MSTEILLDGDAIDKITTLSRAARTAEVVNVHCPFPDAGLPESVPALYDPEARRLLSLKEILESYRTGPARKTGQAVVDTLQSFIDLVNRHKNGSSALFGKVSWPAPSLTAVIDYHPAGGEVTAAAPLRHRIRYEFPLTEEFSTWVAGNGTLMGQAEFASFLEDHVIELATASAEEILWARERLNTSIGTPAEIITMSRGLEITVGHAVKNAYDPRSGESTFTFSEEHKTGAGEKVTVPGGFIVSVAPFHLGEGIRLFARLRYRIKEGAVFWAYRLYRWEDELTLRATADLERARQETGLPAFIGRPES